MPNDGPVTYPLPHRLKRGVWYGLIIALAWVFTSAGSTHTARLMLSFAWALVLVGVGVRTVRLRVVVDPQVVRCFGVLRNRRLRRENVDHMDLDLPARGAFTPGGGERLVAVLHDGRRISLSHDVTRGPDRHCPHYAQLCRALNTSLGPAEPELTDA